MLLAACVLPDPGRAFYSERVPVYNTRAEDLETSQTWLGAFADPVTVPAVMYAAEAELIRRGYTIAERDATLDRGFLIARTSDRRLNQRIIVDARRLDDGADLAVRTDRHRDGATAAEIGQRIAARLGGG